jgi:NitT/TauT family transport system substrate-binding protein
MVSLRHPLLAFALLAFSLAPLPAAPQATTSPLASLRVATTPIDLGSEVFYAKERGFFKKAGLDVEVNVMESGAAIAAAVASGSIDVAQANLVTVATAHDRGLPFVLIAPAGLYSGAAPTTALVVTKTSPLRSAKDLTGKTIAGNGLKNITQIGAFTWIDRNGGDSSAVKFIEMPFAQMGPALAAQRIDAAVIAEPELSAAIAQGDRILAPVYDAIGKEFLIGGWFATVDWTRAHPDLAKRFNAAIAEAARWANAHHAESAPILAKYTKIQATPAMNRATFAERLDPAQIQPLVDAAAKYKVIKAAFPAAALIASP